MLFTALLGIAGVVATDPAAAAPAPPAERGEEKCSLGEGVSGDQNGISGIISPTFTPIFDNREGSDEPITGGIAFDFESEAEDCIDDCVVTLSVSGNFVGETTTDTDGLEDHEEGPAAVSHSVTGDITRAPFTFTMNGPGCEPATCTIQGFFSGDFSFDYSKFTDRANPLVFERVKNQDFTFGPIDDDEPFPGCGPCPTGAVAFEGDYSRDAADTTADSSFDFDGEFIGARTDCPAPVTHTFACPAVTDITDTSARLHGTTTDPTVDRAVFTINPGNRVETVRIFGVADRTRIFTLSLTGLTAETAHTFTVEFFAGATSRGTTLADDECEFETEDEAQIVLRSFLCPPVTAITATSATLNGTTTDPSVDRAVFTVNPGGRSIPVTGTGTFTTTVANLASATDHTLTVAFFQGTTLKGTASGCVFRTLTPVLGGGGTRPDDTTLTAVRPTVPTPPAVLPVQAVAPAPAAVAGTQVGSAPAPAAAPERLAVAGVTATRSAPLARTGATFQLLLLVAIALLVLGAAAVSVWRPRGHHYR